MNRYRTDINLTSYTFDFGKAYTERELEEMIKVFLPYADTISVRINKLYDEFERDSLARGICGNIEHEINRISNQLESTIKKYDIDRDEMIVKSMSALHTLSRLREWVTYGELLLYTIENRKEY